MNGCDCVERHLEGGGVIFCPKGSGCEIDALLPERIGANVALPEATAVSSHVYMRSIPGRDDVVLVGRTRAHASLRDELEAARPTIGLALGFPFPIVQREQARPIPADTRHAFTVAARGPGISRRLRRAILQRLQTTLPLNVLWCDAGAIRARLRSALAVREATLLYVDPFRFVGDSVSHLVHLDAAMRLRRWTTTASVAGNRDVATLGDFTHDTLQAALADLRAKAQHIVVIAPNYIDDQWATTLATMRTALNDFASGCVAVPGRGLLAIREEGDPLMSVLTVRHEPKLLSDAPVQWTQDTSIASLGLRSSTRPRAAARDPAVNARALIAPLASMPERSLPTSMVNYLTREVLDGAAKPVVLLGPPGDVRSQQMVEGIDHNAALALRDLTVREAAERIARASICVVADSFAAHLAVRAHVPSVVLYSADCADVAEPESLLHQSALGFCSRSPLQLPCLLSSLSSPTAEDWNAVAQCREVQAFLTGRSAPTERTIAIADEFVRESRLALRRPTFDLERVAELWHEAVARWTSQEETHTWVWSWFDPSRVLSALRSSSRTRSPGARALLANQAIHISPTAKLVTLHKAAVR